jgi:hypothetical protein
LLQLVESVVVKGDQLAHACPSCAAGFAGIKPSGSKWFLRSGAMFPRLSNRCAHPLR